MGKTSLIRETFRRLEEKQAHYLVFLDVQNCATPEDVVVALSMGASRYETLERKVTDACGAFIKQVFDKVEAVGAPDLLEIKLREGLKGDWQYKGRSLAANLAKADRPVVVCMDELPIMVSRLLGKSSEEAEIFLSWLRRITGEFQERICFIFCGSTCSDVLRIPLPGLVQRRTARPEYRRRRAGLPEIHAEHARPCGIGRLRGAPYEGIGQGENFPGAGSFVGGSDQRDILEPSVCDALFERSGLKDKGPVLREVLDVLEHDGYLVGHEAMDGWRFSSNLLRDWWRNRFSRSYVKPSKLGA